jgi:hypothetical protein
MKAPNEEHAVSTFTLDVYFAQGKTDNPTLATHLETCEPCRNYIGVLEELATTAPLAPKLIPHLSAVGARERRFHWAPVALGAALVAAGFAWLIGSAELVREPQAYVASKGAPAAQAIIKSDGRSQIWDGKRVLRPGDAIALRATCEGFAHLAVVTPSSNGGAWSRLFDGPCPGGNEPLPFTVVADDRPGNERLALVFSASPVSDETLREGVRRGDRTPQIWVIQFLFAKQVSRP